MNFWAPCPLYLHTTCNAVEDVAGGLMAAAVEKCNGIDDFLTVLSFFSTSGVFQATFFWGPTSRKRRPVHFCREFHLSLRKQHQHRHQEVDRRWVCGVGASPFWQSFSVFCYRQTPTCFLGLAESRGYNLSSKDMALFTVLWLRWKHCTNSSLLFVVVFFFLMWSLQVSLTLGLPA